MSQLQTTVLVKTTSNKSGGENGTKRQSKGRPDGGDTLQSRITKGLYIFKTTKEYEHTTFSYKTSDKNIRFDECIVKVPMYYRTVCDWYIRFDI